MTAAPTTRWLTSNKRNPCPICGRIKDQDCRISADGLQVICHRGSTLGPPEGLKPSPEPIKGQDGQEWAFTHYNDRAAHFKLHQPLADGQRKAARKVVPFRRPAAPAPITGPIELATMPAPWPEPPPAHLPDRYRIDYGPGQWTEWADRTGKDGAHQRGERPRHLRDNFTNYTAGPDPWPLFGSDLIPAAAGKWIAAAEGPKCALWLQAGGVVAVSQPGHDHKSESITRRFRELKAAGVAGMVYLADNDATGRQKAEQLVACGAEALVPVLVLQAAEVWPDVPAGGSIDDAPGTAAERVAALVAAIPTAQPDLRETEPATLDELIGPAEEGKLRRPRADKLTRALALLLPLKYNLLTNRIERDGETIHGDYLNGLYLELAEDHGLEVAKDRAVDAAIRVARQRAYHPVQDYLNGINEQLTPEQWASLDLHCFGGEDPSGWGVIHLQRQLIGLVARAMNPGCELHTCLVLQSDQQGIGKSSFWKILGGPWFSDSLGDLRDIREDRMLLHSAWIHEWGEIDNVMGKRESETLKRFISASRDDVRKPYGRGTEHLLRSSGLVGTTNRRDFIKDPTGNRRYPIIQIERVDLEWVKANRDRIWGSAVAAYRDGQQWHYSSAEGQLVSAAAMEYAAADPLRDALESWAEDHALVDEVPIVRILWDLQPDCPIYWERRRDREFMRQVGLALTSLGWAVTGQRMRCHLPDGTRTDRVTLWKRP